jgi:protein phosphatase slingshot
MALLTVERNTPSVESTTDTEEESETLSGSSSFEGFVTTKNFAMCLPQRHWTQITRGDPLHIHFLLKKLVKMMRPRDTLRLCVELERSRDSCSKYLVIITTQGQQDTEEAIVLGTEMTGKEVSIGLVLPIWRDTHIRLDGDGGFIVTTGDRHHVFKTTSVQSMWTALQSLYKLVDVAVLQNYYFQGLSHTWVVWYEQQLTRDRLSLNEW